MTRTRGRPPKTFEETEVIRSQIKNAMAIVFGTHGYHGLSVEHILTQCGLSRPTFYRHFSNTDEVLNLVLQEVNDKLINDITLAVMSVDDPTRKVDAGLLAWRAWGESISPMLSAIFAGIHDPTSPVATHRQRTVAVLIIELNKMAMALGKPPFKAIQVETFLIGVEHLGYSFHLGPDGPTEAAWQLTRQTMMRLALGLLGGSVEWAIAPQLAMAMGLNLD